MLSDLSPTSWLILGIIAYFSVAFIVYRDLSINSARNRATIDAFHACGKPAPLYRRLWTAEHKIIILVSILWFPFGILIMATD